MAYPEITRDQREMAVVLLANALRRDAHLRARVEHFGADAAPLRTGQIKRRAEPSQCYVDGMRDILRVLFADGHAVAEECLEEAYARALGASGPVSPSENDRGDH